MENMQGNKKQIESIYPLSFPAESLLQFACDLVFGTNIFRFQDTFWQAFSDVPDQSCYHTSFVVVQKDILR